MIRVIRVLKVEIEDDSEEDKTQRFITTLLAAITLIVIVQWLFGKCARRNRVQSTPSETPQEEEESEEFEIVSEPEEVNEVATEEPTMTEVVEEATQEEIPEAPTPAV